MEFKSRNNIRPIVVMGLEPETDKKGNPKDVRKVVEGVFQGIRTPPGWSGPVFDVDCTNGETIAVAGCAYIEKALLPEDVGKVVRLIAQGWGQARNGGNRSRRVGVEVDDDSRVGAS